MESDLIVAEIRKLREEYAARFGFDVRAMVLDAQERDSATDREVVRRVPRRPRLAEGSSLDKSGEFPEVPPYGTVDFILYSLPENKRCAVHGPTVRRSSV